MIRVTIEIVPGGFEPAKRTIASLTISNVSELARISSYEVDATEAANLLSGTPSRTASFRIENHNRHQPVWALLARAAAFLASADFQAL